MKDAWWNVLDRVLQPARPKLAQCLRERAPHFERREARATERARAIARCEARIEAARSEVFAAKDGIVGRRMTELEREWRTLARRSRSRAHGPLGAHRTSRVDRSKALARRRAR